MRIHEIATSRAILTRLLQGLVASMLLAVAAIPSVVVASPLQLETLLAQFNLVTEGDLFSSQEIEGRAHVGGDLTGSTMQVGFRNVPAGAWDTLSVGGSVTMSALTIQNGGDLRVGGNIAGNVEMNDGTQGNRTARIGGTHTSGTFNQGTKIENLSGDPDFEAGFAVVDFNELRSDSEQLARLGGTAVDTSNPNNIRFLGGVSPTALTVLSVDIVDLASGTFTVDNQAAETLLINVSGTSGTFGGNLAGGDDAAENVLWNFFEATSISVNTRIVGSVLAPHAHMAGFGGSTEGSVIARSVALTNGELHSRPFEGSLLLTAFSEPTAEIPLPATAWLLLVGLGVLGLFRRTGMRSSA